MRLWFLLPALAACSSSPAAADQPPIEQQPLPSADKPTKSAGKLFAHWTNVKTTPGCFYFSGPSGRDDRLVGPVVLGKDDGELTARIADVVFEGTYTRDAVVLVRHSRHEFARPPAAGDRPWHVTETIQGRLVADGVVGRYHYEECELDRLQRRTGGACPGRCTIDADLAFRR